MATDSGRALMEQLLTQQATIIAYANDFKLLMLLTLATIPLVLVIGRARRAGAAKARPLTRWSKRRVRCRGGPCGRPLYIVVAMGAHKGRPYTTRFDLETRAQYDLGNPSTCSARYDRIRLVEIGATV